ncbi:tetratricopeptide repeat protein [Candidatus Poribacteria bacterium]|nr:tetratricopeptide repeat protein [Candidatus Poribacteria bacterium]
METQSTLNASSMLEALALDPALRDVIPSESQLFQRSEPIQIQGQIRLSASTVSTTYPESAYQWLVEVLDGLIDFGQRHGHYGVIELTEDEYQWLDDILEELIYSVGENQSHPLAPLMRFIIRIIANYEDAYVPKLTERFPELAEEAPIEVARKNKKPDKSTSKPKPSDNELASRAFFSIGYFLYQGNETEKALPAYDKAIVFNPDFWEAFYNRGIERYNFKQYPEAMADFNKVIKLNSNFTSAYYNRGILKSELKDYEGAIADFDKAITLGFNCAEVYCYRASANALLGEYDAAVSDYDKVIELKPDFVEAYNIRGILRSELGQYDEALADYTEAIRIKPDYAKTYAYRGVLEAHLGRINKARSDFQKALELAEQQENIDAKAFVEKELQQLNQAASKQNNKEPRQGGQWKGKVKIAEDFDELPESFMASFDAEEEEI